MELPTDPRPSGSARVSKWSVLENSRIFSNLFTFDVRLAGEKKWPIVRPIFSSCVRGFRNSCAWGLLVEIQTGIRCSYRSSLQ
ncbi:unnamed protein product, partial [Staurois parvus]